MRPITTLRIIIASAFAMGAVAAQFLPLAGMLGGAVLFVVLWWLLER